jgi:hypothetical protein
VHPAQQLYCGESFLGGGVATLLAGEPRVVVGGPKLYGPAASHWLSVREVRAASHDRGNRLLVPKLVPKSVDSAALGGIRWA